MWGKKREKIAWKKKASRKNKSKIQKFNWAKEKLQMNRCSSDAGMPFLTSN